jgi:hypothetical protein
MFVLFPIWCLHFIVTAVVASPADAQTLSSSYQASIHFRTLSCFLTPGFEVGCTGGDDSSLVVEDGVTVVGDTAGSVTCILHPTKGDLYRLCTASVLAGIDGLEQSAQFAIRFRCKGLSPDLLSSVVEIVTNTAQCAPVKPTGNATSMPSIYYSASLAAYDDSSGEEEDASQLDYSQVCQQGVPEELLSDEEGAAFGCVQYVSGCNGTSSLSSQSSGSNGCTLPLQSTRTSFDGASLPDGAIRTAEQDIRDDEKQRRPGLAIILGVIVVVVAAAAVLFAVVTHFVRNSNSNNNTREMQPRQQLTPPPPKPASEDSAKTMRTELSSATLDVPDKKAAAVIDKTTTSARFEVDPDQIQKYGFRVIRQHLNGPESNELSPARLPL